MVSGNPAVSRERVRIELTGRLYTVPTVLKTAAGTSLAIIPNPKAKDAAKAKEPIQSIPQSFPSS